MKISHQTDGRPSAVTTASRWLAALALGAALLFPAAVGAADLLHNSADTGSTKWQAQGGWGVAGGKYGKFECATCHEPDADNLKNIRSTISTMDGSNWPNGQPSVSVAFQNQTGMGNDYAGRASSNRICEVCHSQNRFHNFNAANNTGGYLHPTPKEVCINCHKHNTGFKAACGGCHGNPPTTNAIGGDYGLIGTPRPSNAMPAGAVGAHTTHTQTRAMVCDTCHYISNGGVKMPNQSGTIQIGFFGFGGKVTSGTYTPYSSSNRGYRFASGTPNTTIAPVVTSYANANKCANVYCHGGGAPGKAALTNGTNQTPQWDATGQNLCGTCHGKDAAAPPTLGNHAIHAGNSGTYNGYAYTCDTCHPYPNDNSHVQGNLRWKFSATDPRVAGALYQAAGAPTALNEGSTGDLAPSAAYGQCSNLYCHSDGKGGPANVATPTWGNNSPFANCKGCHGGNATSGAPIASGKHTQHVDNSGRIGTNLGCAECHATTVTSDTTIGTRANHVNQLVNYSGARAGRNKAACSASYCHSNGKGSQGVAVDWTAAAPAQFATCRGCHGNLTPSFANFTSKAGEPNYPNTGAAGSATSNSHKSHTTKLALKGAASCEVCHVNTVTTAGSAIKAGSLHLDKSIDVFFDTGVAGAGANYTKATRTCNGISCHGGATPGPVWGDASSAGCKVCHTSLSGAHAAHVGDLITAGTVTYYNFTANRSTGAMYRYGCATCHPAVTGTTHQNGQVEVILRNNKPGANYLTSLNNLVTTDTGGYTKTGSTSFTCDTVYCHSNGRAATGMVLADYRQSPNWYGGPYTGNKCGMCHDNPPQYAGQSHYVASSAMGDNGTGSVSETGHMIGIHSMNSSTGNNQNGFLGFSSGGSKAHGNTAVATTITCYLCHDGVVSRTQTDTYAMNGTSSQFRCGSCHTSSTATRLQAGVIADTSRHVNGGKDVVFAPVQVKTKAQLSNVANALGWTRTGSYKAAASYDSITDLKAASTWYPAEKRCMTACHVNQPGIVWGTPLTCVSCHANQ